MDPPGVAKVHGFGFTVSPPEKWTVPAAQAIPVPTCPPLAARDTLIALLHPVATRATSTGHVALTGAPPLSCRSYGSAKGNRTAAACKHADDSDLSCHLINAGAVREWERYSKGAYRHCAPKP